MDANGRPLPIGERRGAAYYDDSIAWKVPWVPWGTPSTLSTRAVSHAGCTVVREVVWAARGEGPSEYPEYDGT